MLVETDEPSRVVDLRRGGWFWISNEVVTTFGPQIGIHGLAVYAVLAQHSDASGQAFPSVQRIAKLMNCSPGTARKGIAALEQAGLIKREIHQSRITGWRATVYTLLETRRPEAPQPEKEAAEFVPPGSNSDQRLDQTLTLGLGQILTTNKTQQRNKTQSNNTERYGSGFTAFWTAYPRKIARQKAWQAWKKIRAGPELVAAILRSIAEHKQTEQWQQVRLIPHPATFLNQRRWEDDVSKEPKALEFQEPA